MNWYEIALGVVLIAVSLLIIVFTLAQEQKGQGLSAAIMGCLLYTSPSPRDTERSRMPSSA